MSERVKVNLFCMAEQMVVAEIEVEQGLLSAEKMTKGIGFRDKRRCPPSEVILDGAQLMCATCYNPLRFSTGDGDYIAVPGSIQVYLEADSESEVSESTA